MNPELKVPNEILFILNQVFEMEQKISKIKESHTLHRNVEKLKNFFADGLIPNGVGLVYHNPLGEKYDDTRTDCEASISGASTQNLKIIEVIKPIIRIKKGNVSQIVQKAVVVVEGNESNLQALQNA